MKVGTILHGFAVQRVRELDELQAKLWEMEHIKSGAQLCWLERADENKAFSIAFKTLPEDSTGVFHILEHSVLCGSDKYPVKEPFVELLKSSVQTFLNAMTFPDKTVYPVSSRNDQDFLNLMDVYLDAVFHPAIYHRPEIFRQEGWRYEGDKDGLCYQGVVLNEMKGTFSNPESILRNTEKELLFPDTCYRFVSGGDPDRIPELTYEAFIAAHKKYYHPSNSRISLVGSVEINSVLQKLDDFLREFDVSSEKTAIAYQKPVESVERTVSYAIGENESSHQRTIVSCASLMGTYRDRVRNYATAVLADYLTGDDDAPLKRAVLEQGLCQDFAVTVHDGMLQSLVSWEAWYTDQELLPHLRSTIHDTLTEIVKKGLDKERLDASLCQFAFRMRDRDSGGSPRSLNEALELLDTWLYGGDPAEGVTVEQPIRELLEKRDSGYFEELIRKLFLDNDHTVTVILVPSNTFSHEKAEREQQRITVAANRWTSAEWDTFAKETEALKQWQQTPDSEDALAAIPMLRLDDLPDAPEPVEVMQTHCQDIPMLCHKLPSELAHFRVHFLATDLETWELPALSIFCRLLGSMAAGRHSRSLLPLQIKRTLGQLDIYPTILAGNTPEHCKIYLSVSAVCLPEQSAAAADLLTKILTQTLWEDTALLQDILQQMNMSYQMALPENGHQFAATRALSGLTAHNMVSEYTGGLEFARWLKTMSEADEGALRDLLVLLDKLMKRLIVRERMTLSCSYGAGEDMAKVFCTGIPSGSAAPEEMHCTLSGAMQEGVIIPAAVGFSTRGTNLRLHHRAYSGCLPVMEKILNFTFLWDEIRVKGGAYGCGFRGRDNGDLVFSTYRDPQPGRSLEIMVRAADFLRAFCADDHDLTGFILSAVSALDPLRTASERMTEGEMRWFRGISEEDVCRRYQELIHTTPGEILTLCPMLEELIEDNAICAVAGKLLLEQCQDSLNKVFSFDSKDVAEPFFA